jgi:hypothetical protein
VVSRRLRLLLAAFAGVMVALCVLSARSAADAPSTSDIAVIETYTRLASHAQLLVGAYSRFQWHHPGPLPFYALVPAYWLGGQHTAALSAGAALVSLAVLYAIGHVLVRRRDGLSVALSLGMALLAWRTADGLVSPWNPHLGFLPMTGLVVVAADVLAGEAAMLPWVAVLASLSAQAHVGLAPTAVAVAVVPTLRAVAGAATSTSHAPWRACLAWTTVVLAAAWAIPILEQLQAGATGNVAELWRFFAAGSSTSGQSPGVAVSAWADMFVGVARPDLAIARGEPFVESPVVWAEWACLATLGGLAATLAWRVRATRTLTFSAALSVLLLLAATVSLWSVSRITDRVFDHDVFWIAGLGALSLSAAVHAATDAVRLRVEVHRAGLAAIVVGGCMVAMLEVSGAVRLATAASHAPAPDAIAARQLGTDLYAWCSAHGVTRPLLQVPEGDWGIVAGAILELHKRGRAVAVPDDWVVMFTPAFRRTGREDAVVAVVGGSERERLEQQRAERISSAGRLSAYVVAVRR